MRINARLMSTITAAGGVPGGRGVEADPCVPALGAGQRGHKDDEFVFALNYELNV